MKDFISVSIIGAGQIGQTHAESFHSLGDQVKISSIVDVDENRGRKMAEKVDAKYVADYRQVLAEKPDLVVICLPHTLHKEVGIAAAQAGCHMLMEKPIANTVEDAMEIVSQCKRNHVFMAVSFAHRYRLEYQQAKRLISEGFVGKPYTVSDIFTTNGGIHVPGWVWNKKLSGGGIMMYSGIHSIDWQCWLMDSKISEVFANGLSYDESTDVEAQINGLLQFENGSTGTIIGRQPPYLVTARTRDTEVIGDKGRLRIRMGEYLDGSSEHQSFLWTTERDAPFITQAASIIKSIREKTEPWINYHDGLRAQAVIEALYKSIECKKAIKVEYPENN